MPERLQKIAMTLRHDLPLRAAWIVVVTIAVMIVQLLAPVYPAAQAVAGLISRVAAVFVPFVVF